MKFNWGTGIFIFIIIFVSGIGSLIYISFQHDINLVYKDYYPREIDHQRMIEKVRNTKQLDGRIAVTCVNNIVEVGFPEIFRFDKIEGEIQLYRPSDFNKDEVFIINLSDSGTQKISTNGLQKGRYIVKIEWAYNETDYYFEKPIHVK